MKLNRPIVILLIAFLAAGCTTKSKARVQARKAFAAGQQQAMSQQAEARRTSIRILGNVRNPDVEWADGLTLMQAIVAADCVDRRTPREILIIRQRETFPVDPKALLRGEDVPLEPGDTVEIHLW